jgi:hypothetical protein
LDKIYHVIPWKEIVKNSKIKEPRKGQSVNFSLRAKQALIFLKACNGLSDWKLIDQQKKIEDQNRILVKPLSSVSSFIILAGH